MKNSAKGFCKAMMDQGYDEEMAKGMAHELIKAGSLFNDLEEDEKDLPVGKGAFELLETLLELGIESDDAHAQVDAAIKKGEVHDDLGLSDIPDTSDLDELIYDLEKGAEFDGDLAFDLDNIDTMDDDEADEAIAKGMLNAAQAVPQLRATIAAMGRSHIDNVEAVASVLNRVVRIEKGITKLLAGLDSSAEVTPEAGDDGEVPELDLGIAKGAGAGNVTFLSPVTPLTGVEVEASPHEQGDSPIAKGTEAAQSNAASGAKTREHYMSEWGAHIGDVRISTLRKSAYQEGITRLASGEDLETVAEDILARVASL